MPVTPRPGPLADWPLLLAAGLLNLVLVLPLWLRFGEPGAHWIALEAWWLPVLFAWLAAHWTTHAVRATVAVVLILAVAAGLGDAATQHFLGRSLNLYFDLPALASVHHLLVGTLGQTVAVAILALGAVLLLGVLIAVFRGLRPIPLSGGVAGLALGIGALAAVLTVLEVAGERVVPVARTPVVDTLAFQSRQIRETHQARRQFESTVADRERPVQPLPGLAGRDVYLVFVESYGASVTDDPRFSGVVLPRLEAMAPRLEAAGLHAVTGRLNAPILGGQSWLAHASLLSGVWIDNPLWYRLLLELGQPTLVDDFQATGHETLTVMPAITMPWPEGRAYGFDHIFAAADLDYAGPPLNWVTMPDQFTLHRFNALRASVDAPLFAKVALVSSHAPWTPILPLIDDWEQVADGQIFAPWGDTEPSPETLWQDMERVRDHFARSVDYSLHVSLDWALRFLEGDALLILLGDHQAAPLIIGEAPSPAVPMHLISRDPQLLAPFRERGFVPGLVPPRPGQPAGMDAFRHWLHADFGPG
ncbi:MULTISPECIES: sulfatase [unclassified Ectothiorhodospira]|uniref:sulfatase n=1 Tax=unclassified Ectothiorhodospira TaxID=2684909 RepID=UPI001EE982BC|nr:MULTISPECIES: sulfatase [unclassified Ectothiorhodospira]MCG5514784.1 sulfatase [Ectothiorhodospira sp. 9100]MCG5518952.1 sulfatase [Ectothiorhodospira sp. 9905]